MSYPPAADASSLPIGLRSVPRACFDFSPSHLLRHPLLPPWLSCFPVSSVSRPSKKSGTVDVTNPPPHLVLFTHPAVQKTNPLGERLAQAAHDIRWSAHRGDHPHRHCVSNSPAVQGSALAGKNQIKGIALDGESDHCTAVKIDSLPD